MPDPTSSALNTIKDYLGFNADKRKSTPEALTAAQLAIKQTRGSSSPSTSLAEKNITFSPASQKRLNFVQALIASDQVMIADAHSIPSQLRKTEDLQTQISLYENSIRILIDAFSELNVLFEENPNQQTLEYLEELRIQLNTDLKEFCKIKTQLSIAQFYQKNTDLGPVPINTEAALQSIFGGKIESLIALIQKDKLAPIYEPVLGPAQLSKGSQEFSVVSNILLKEWTEVKYENGNLITKDGNIIDLQGMIATLDLSHTLLEDDLVSNFETLVKNTLVSKPQKTMTDKEFPTAEYFKENDPDGACEAISYSEKLGINIYTGSFYAPINLLLRGDISSAIKKFKAIPDKKDLSDSEIIKELLLLAAVAGSGLAKLPYNTDGNQKSKEFVFRAEGNLFPEDLLVKQREAVTQGGKTIPNIGFTSTSHKKPAANFAGKAKAITLFQGRGKNVECLSQWGKSEREEILIGGQTQYCYHVQINAPLNKKIDLFIARVLHGPVEKPVILNDSLASDANAIKETLSNRTSYMPNIAASSITTAANIFEMIVTGVSSAFDDPKE